MKKIGCKKKKKLKNNIPHGNHVSCGTRTRNLSYDTERSVSYGAFVLKATKPTYKTKVSDTYLNLSIRLKLVFLVAFFTSHNFC